MPASSPILYGVVLVHCTARVEVLSTLAASTPWLPKSSVDVLLITQADATVICTVKVEVTWVALDEPANGSRNNAAKASLSFGRRTTGTEWTSMTTPRKCPACMMRRTGDGAFRDRSLLVCLQ